MSIQQQILEVQQALVKGIQRCVDGSSEALVFMKEISDLFVEKDNEIANLKERIRELEHET